MGLQRDGFQIPQTTFPGSRILIVDDEASLRRTLADLFRRLGHDPVEAASGQEALWHLSHQTFDLVLLDLKMPQMDGTEILEEAGDLNANTVFIVLTAYGSLDTAILALRHGAFDYLLKPSPMQEIARVVEAGLAERQKRVRRGDPVNLLERALATLREDKEIRPPETPQRFLRGGELTVDTLKQLVVVRGEEVELTLTEYEMLVYLMRHRERVISAGELVEHLRGYDLDERDARDFLRAHLYRLRHKIECDPSEPIMVVTIRGSGYRFVGGVEASTL